MSKLLTKQEIGRLTGAPASSARAQMEVLDANRIPYVRRKDGSPALTWEMVNQATLTRNTSKRTSAGANLPTGFNLDAIN
ncbi:DUF4224 domain-containing protein [Microbulbifer epialgicus]|uniref:DUF4224 domain-containing protein n=1 Tax=Microbulbifer epialgicus TaxID=393907 RepID=A0ABV4P5H5_9GAMM